MATPHASREPFWPALAAVAAALALYVTLPHRLTMGPSWIVPALETGLLVPLGLTTPHRVPGESMRVRSAALALIGVIGAANALALALLVHRTCSPAGARGRRASSTTCTCPSPTPRRSARPTRCRCRPGRRS
jgi:hypothetical protein